MTAKLDPFAAAPSLMKSWAGTSVAVAIVAIYVVRNPDKLRHLHYGLCFRYGDNGSPGGKWPFSLDPWVGRTLCGSG